MVKISSGLLSVLPHSIPVLASVNLYSLSLVLLYLNTIDCDSPIEIFGILSVVFGFTERTDPD